MCLFNYILYIELPVKFFLFICLLFNSSRNWLMNIQYAKNKYSYEYSDLCSQHIWVHFVYIVTCDRRSQVWVIQNIFHLRSGCLIYTLYIIQFILNIDGASEKKSFLSVGVHLCIVFQSQHPNNLFQCYIKKKSKTLLTISKPYKL